MSIELPNLQTEEQKIGWELLEENPILIDDAYARTMVKSGGRTETGEKVDIGDFLAARLAFLELRKAEEKVAAAKQRNSRAYDVAVISSVRPDMESHLGN